MELRFRRTSGLHLIQCGWDNRMLFSVELQGICRLASGKGSDGVTRNFHRSHRDTRYSLRGGIS